MGSKVQFYTEQNRMKRLSALAFLMALPLVAPALDLESIYDPNLNGIPKVLGLKWLDQENLKLCETLSWDFYGISPEKCRKIVLERTPGCFKKFYPKAPAVFRSKEKTTAFSIKYLECSRPGFFCYGHETRNAEQRRLVCKEPSEPIKG